MAIAEKSTYLLSLANEMKIYWPQNRLINICCHGHSVPSGYFDTPAAFPFESYPHLLHKILKDRFTFASLNVIVTAIGGEGSESGAKRFTDDVLCHKPDLITIDYGLNDRGLGLVRAEKAWSAMAQLAQERGIKVILMTPTMDINAPDPEKGADLKRHVEQIRVIASRYEVGLADSYAAYEKYISDGGALTDILSWANHPNRRGHELVRDELFRWFPVEY